MRLKLPTKISLDTDRQAQSRLTSCLLTFHVHCQESDGRGGEGGSTGGGWRVVCMLNRNNQIAI